MPDPVMLQRPIAWFSPAFPVGAFAYSAGFETAIAEAARKAETSSLDDLGAIGFAATIAAMAHETQRVRILRS